MIDQWKDKSVDLGNLEEFAETFFRKRKFRVTRESQPAERRITAFPALGSELCDSIEVTIRGKPDDFTVEFYESQNSTRRFMRLGGLTTILGGGVLLRKGLRSQEEFDKLESQFWADIDARLASLEQERAEKREE